VANKGCLGHSSCHFSLNPPGSYSLPRTFAGIACCGFFHFGRGLFAHNQCKNPVFMRVFEKTYRRLPCVFLQALSMAKAVFPQVFCYFSWFFCHFFWNLDSLCDFVKAGKPLHDAAGAHSRGLNVG
jgi:hypothetical protein